MTTTAVLCSRGAWSDLAGVGAQPRAEPQRRDRGRRWHSSRESDVLAGNSWLVVATVVVPLVIASALRGPIGVVPAVIRGRRLFDEGSRFGRGRHVPAVAVPLLGAAIWGLPERGVGDGDGGELNSVQSVRVAGSVSRGRDDR